MRPLMISSGGAFAKVIKEHEQLKTMARYVLLDTSDVDLGGFSPIKKNGKKPGYIIMNEGLDEGLLSKYGISISDGRKGINREKEVFVLAFALDGKETEISAKIWKKIRDSGVDAGSDCNIFLAGLAGGTGSGSINCLINNYYKNWDYKGKKHAVIGILPSFYEEKSNLGDESSRIRLNALWALYELMVGQPTGIKSPIILLDNQAMMTDKNPKPTEPVGNVLSMFNDWRPDRDAGDILSISRATIIPYYASIKKDRLNEINEDDINNMLTNLRISNGKINTNPNSGRWYLTVNKDDITKVSGGQLITKGIPNEYMNYLKDNILKYVNIDAEDLPMQSPLLNVPGKAEVLLLLKVDNGFELSRIKSLYDDVFKIENSWIESTIRKSIPREEASLKVVIDFISKMKEAIKEGEETNTFPKKYQIVFNGNGFEVKKDQDT